MTQPNTNEPQSPDGARWVALDENSKYAYIVGFLEGMFLGHCFTTWGLPGGSDDDPAYLHASQSYSNNWNQFVSRVTYRRFREGLDTLYNDEQNRKIAVRHGLWIVMNQAIGKPDRTMETMIASFREEAERPETGSLNNYSKGLNLVH